MSSIQPKFDGSPELVPCRKDELGAFNTSEIPLGREGTLGIKRRANNIQVSVNCAMPELTLLVMYVFCRAVLLGWGSYR